MVSRIVPIDENQCTVRSVLIKNDTKKNILKFIVYAMCRK